MAEKTETERITYLEKRVNELQKELVEAQNPRIFGKVLITLILVGACFLMWKCRTFLKWAILALLAWWVFGDIVINAFNGISNFTSTTWNEWRAESRAEDVHNREMERIRTEANVSNSRVKAEADAKATEVQANADADNSRTRTEADARTKVLEAEETAKQAEWERNQAERRNDAINDAIRGGHWHANTPVTASETIVPPASEIAKPEAVVNTEDSKPALAKEPNVTVNAPGRTPKVFRTQEGNVTRVVVRF